MLTADKSLSQDEIIILTHLIVVGSNLFPVFVKAFEFFHFLRFYIFQLVVREVGQNPLMYNRNIYFARKLSRSNGSLSRISKAINLSHPNSSFIKTFVIVYKMNCMQ